MRIAFPLVISLTPAERRELKAGAENEGLSMAALVRQRVFGSDHGNDLLKALAAVDGSWTQRLNRIDANLAKIRELREAAERDDLMRRTLSFE